MTEVIYGLIGINICTIVIAVVEFRKFRREIKQTNQLLNRANLDRLQMK